jgi:hypothetical protein
MSKVVIQGNASGTGNFTIAAPNSNTDRTLTLPDEAGTVLTTAGVPSSAMPAGSVLQVVHNTTPVARHTSTSTVFIDTGFSVTITPKFANSKILINTIGVGYSSSHYAYHDVYRDGTTSISGSANNGNGITGPGAYTPAWDTLVSFYFDSPNTTSAVTYNLFAKTVSGTLYCGISTNAVYPNSVYLSATEIAQ